MTTFALNKTPAITLPKIKLNSQTALRILVASYFSGAAMGLASGPDVAGALSAAMPESAANIIGNGALLMLSFLVLSGLALRKSAAVLAAMVLFASTISILPFIGTGSTDDLWRDATLLAALMLTYTKSGPKVPEERPVERVAAGKVRAVCRLKPTEPVTPRRVQPTTSLRQATTERLTAVEVKAGATVEIQSEVSSLVQADSKIEETPAVDTIEEFVATTEDDIKNEAQATVENDISDNSVACLIAQEAATGGLEFNDVTTEAEAKPTEQKQLIVETSELPAVQNVQPSTALMRFQLPDDLTLFSTFADANVFAETSADEDEATDEMISDLIKSNVAFQAGETGRSLAAG